MATHIDCTRACNDEDPAAARRLLDAMPEPHLRPRQVSKAVGNVRDNGPELIEPVQASDDQPQDLLF